MNKVYIAGGCEYNNSISHHGIKGQKWGERRYQNPDGTLTEEGIKRYSKSSPRKMTKIINRQNKKRIDLFNLDDDPEYKKIERKLFTENISLAKIARDKNLNVYSKTGKHGKSIEITKKTKNAKQYLSDEFLNKYAGKNYYEFTKLMLKEEEEAHEADRDYNPEVLKREKERNKKYLNKLKKEVNN